ncbi:NAD(P)/FAD-dependent oxidoreductase [Propionispora vibrioides]|uniref:Thioredoxin reductase n=1 Tax=Propionispora vibrioides TaxID=112903 RepID=A0A1H8X640_9FIRM|nr:FAD-dependent oxidoreductase [Propionispora vibrioides]SEP34788.1 Thioredoxin reductase [Propionispora vibrioides]
MKQFVDIAIIGGGPAGLAAAYSAAEQGAENILIIERDRELGGILQQCIHNGFGLHRFKEELTGPGYARRYIQMVGQKKSIRVMLDTMVLDVQSDKTVIAANPQDGLCEIHCRAVVFTMGCRERTRGAIRIPGERPAGVFTAGVAQRMTNMEGCIPGKSIVILGSGDIGLIMARRLTLEGAKVEAVIELMPYSNGLTRNVVQCLEDYQIPLYLGHTITTVAGRDRVTSVTCAKVDENLRPVAGTEFDIACDCLLLSVGLIPENELSQRLVDMDKVTSGPVVDQYRQTSAPGFFAAGNVVHVHDLVDFVSEEGAIAGRAAALYAQNRLPVGEITVQLISGTGIRTVVPQKLTVSTEPAPAKLFLRVKQPAQKVILAVESNGQTLLSRKLSVVKPGEMIMVEIPAAKLAGIGQEIIISLNQGGE